MSFVLLAAALATQPQKTVLHANWRTCVVHGKTNLDFAACGEIYVRAADAGLNVQWSRISAAADPATKAALLREQRAWLAYRVQVCAFYGLQVQWGREGEVLHRPECVAQVIERRTKELADYRAFIAAK